MWVFASVPRLKVGEGTLSQLADEVRTYGTKVGVVYGRHLAQDGTLEEILALMRINGIQATPITGPAGEPTIREAAIALSTAQAAGCAVIVGVGGGSVMDIAKAVAGLYNVKGDALQTVTANLYDGPSDAQALPWVAVPTTAGTGSEVTHVCVLTDPARGIKQSMRSSSWYARSVVIDPTLYTSAPPHVTAAAGMDALTQAIESHISRGATALTKALSLQATVLLAKNLVRAYRDGGDIEARQATALGSCLAGMALSNARLGVVHGLAHPVGLRYGLAHGLTCAVLLPYAMRFNMPIANEGFAELAVATGIAAEGPLLAQRLVEFVVEINKRMQIPATLGQLGMQAHDIPALAKDALPSGSTKANPRLVELGDLVEMLSAAL